MAWALVDHDIWGVTARMTVEFRRPVPIEPPIRAEGWVVRSRRRIVEADGRIVDAAHGDRLAPPTGTFVAAEPRARRSSRPLRVPLLAPDAAADTPDSVDRSA